MFGNSLGGQISHLNNTWEKHAIQTERKVEAIYRIHKHFGYGGFIHHFKNLVLRLDHKYIPLSEQALNDTYHAIDSYLALPTSDEERDAIAAFRQVVEEYDQKFAKAKQLIGDDTNQQQLDSIVKTDDTLAFNALKVMSDSIQQQLQQAQIAGQKALDKNRALLDTQFKLVVIFCAALGIAMVAIIVRLTKSLNEIQILFQASPDALIESDTRGQILRVNKKATEVFGYNAKEFLTLKIEDLIPSKFRSLHKQQREDFQSSKRVQAMEDRNMDLFGQRKGGEIFPAEIAISVFETGSGKSCVSILRDITARKDLEKRSNTDYLTQLDNRLRIDQTLTDEIARARRYQRPLSVITCDIDHFKEINDRFGHQAGDNTLVEIANFLKQRIRSMDSIGRWGGEEFLICCPETDASQALLLAEELRNGLRTVFSESENAVTISLGVTELQQTQDDSRSLLARADQALYQAKSDGRNCSRMA